MNEFNLIVRSVTQSNILAGQKNYIDNSSLCFDSLQHHNMPALLLLCGITAGWHQKKCHMSILGHYLYNVHISMSYFTADQYFLLLHFTVTYTLYCRHHMYICFELLWLQLDPGVNLERQCIAGAGMVQVNIALNCDKSPPRLNISDVLQPPGYLDDSNG